MRKIIVGMFLSLDGVMEAPETWQFPYITPDVNESIQAQILESDALLLGRVTYEIFASYWPLQTHNEFGIADKLNNQPKYVVSSTLKKAEWNNTTIINNNAMAEIARLKQQLGGDIAVTGSATLIEALMQADLIDEYQLQVHPVVLGSGRRLFRDGSAPKTLNLVDSKAFSSGVVLLTYQPATGRVH
jgi:dihydrofolate reductase